MGPGSPLRKLGQLQESCRSWRSVAGRALLPTRCLGSVLTLGPVCANPRPGAYADPSLGSVPMPRPGFVPTRRLGSVQTCCLRSVPTTRPGPVPTPRLGPRPTPVWGLCQRPAWGLCLLATWGLCRPRTYKERLHRCLLGAEGALGDLSSDEAWAPHLKAVCSPEAPAPSLTGALRDAASPGLSVLVF